MTGMMGIGAAIALFPGGQAAGGATLGASGVGYIIYSYQKIYCYYGDPFDPNFAAVFSPQFHDQPAISTDDCLTAALADEMTQTLNHFRRANSYLQAVQMTLNREQSAYTFGDDASANLQDAALPGYTDGIVSELTAFKNGIRDIATQLTGSLCDITISQDDVVAFINAVQAGGIDALPQVVRDLLTLFGVDPTVVVAAIINTDPTQVPLNFAAALNAVADVAGQNAGGYQP